MHDGSSDVDSHNGVPFQGFVDIFFIYLMIKFNQAIRYASQHIWYLFQARINWEGCARKGIRHKNGGDGRDGAPISLDGVAVHPDCLCVCLWHQQLTVVLALQHSMPWYQL